MTRLSDLIQAAFWHQPICLECGEVGEEGTPLGECPECGEEALVSSVVLRAYIASVLDEEEGTG